MIAQRSSRPSSGVMMPSTKENIVKSNYVSSSTAVRPSSSTVRHPPYSPLIPLPSSRQPEKKPTWILARGKGQRAQALQAGWLGVGIAPKHSYAYSGRHNSPPCPPPELACQFMPLGVQLALPGGQKPSPLVWITPHILATPHSIATCYPAAPGPPHTHRNALYAAVGPFVVCFLTH